MKKETLLNISAALTIAPILSYTIMWLALDDGSCFFNLDGIIHNTDPSFCLYIAVAFAVGVMLFRPTNSGHTNPLPRVYGRAVNIQGYNVIRKPTQGGIVSLCLCAIYLTATIICIFCHSNAHLFHASFIIIAVLYSPLGWLSAASVATNVSVCNWITFQMLSIGNCFLLGYGIVALVRSFRNQYYLSGTSMLSIPKEAEQAVAFDGQPPPCSVSTADSTAPADAL